MATIIHTVKLAADTQKAIAEMERYEGKIVAVAQTVAKYERTLSGEKMLLGANNMTAALGKLGGATGDLITKENLLAGASRLTTDAKARLNTELGRAIEKYQAIGKHAPAAMHQAYEATKTVPPLMERVAAAAQKVDMAAMNLGMRLQSVGKGLSMAITAPLAGMAVGAVKAAIDFETSFAGVRKTVDATEEQFKQLAAGFRAMSKEIPLSVDEINRIGEAAGQLGIKTDSILGFTRVMADLGATTNMSSDQAATALARLANITQMPQDQFDRLGSTIVDLGNKFASTEAEIVDFGVRIAGAGTIAGLTEAQILAIGTAMSSVGVEAEAGGTAIQKVLLGMTQAAAEGGAELTVFAKTAGMSAQEFARAFKDDAGAAFVSFVEGLGRQGDKAFATLEALDMTDQRLIRSFLSLAGAGDLLSRSMQIGTKAWEDNSALAEEARKRYETVASQLGILWNKVKDVAIQLGDALMPVLRTGVQVLTDWLPVLENTVRWFAGLPEPVQKVAIGLGALLAAIGPVLYISGQLVMSVGALAGVLAYGLNPALAASAGHHTAAAGAAHVHATALGTLTAASRAWLTSAVGIAVGAGVAGAALGGVYLSSILKATMGGKDLKSLQGDIATALYGTQKATERAATEQLRFSETVTVTAKATKAASVTFDDHARKAKGVAMSYADMIKWSLPFVKIERDIVAETERLNNVTLTELDKKVRAVAESGLLMSTSLAGVQTQLPKVEGGFRTTTDALGTLESVLGTIATIFNNIEGKGVQMAVVVVRAFHEIVKSAQSAGTSIAATASGLAGTFIAFYQIAVMASNGASKMRAELDKSRRAFIDTAGGADELIKRLIALGQPDLVSRILYAPNLEAFNRAVDDFNKVVERWEKRVQGLESAAGGLQKMADAFAAPFRKLKDELDKLSKDVADGLIPEDKLKLTEQRIHDIVQELAKMADKGQGEFDRLGTYAAVIFGQILRETGSLPRAFEAVKPSLDVLIELQDTFGLKGSETTQEMLRLYRTIEANKPAMQALDGLTQIMGGLTQAGAVSQGVFNMFGADLASIFAKLTGNGVDAKMALVLMQPALQKLWELQDKFGFEVDEGTQALLNQAQTAGIVGPNMRSVNEQILGVLGKIKTVLDEIKGLWESAKAKVDDYATAVGNIPDMPAGPQPGDPDYRVHGGGPIYHTGGKVLAFQRKVLRAHTGLAVDEVPAILQTGEFVLSRRDVSRIGMATIQAMRAGARPNRAPMGATTVQGGPTYQFNVSLPGNVFLQTPQDKARLAREVGDAIMQEMRMRGRIGAVA